jgi:hypothetical protein
MKKVVVSVRKLPTRAEGGVSPLNGSRHCAVTGHRGQTGIKTLI